MGAARMSLNAGKARRVGFWLDVSLGAGLVFFLI
jgi:hypothetical protein